MELTLLKNKLLQSLKFRGNQTLTIVELIDFIEEVEKDVQNTKDQLWENMDDAYNECTNPNQ